MSDDMTDFDPFEDLSDEELDAMLESGELAGGMKPAELCADVPEGFRSGFVALVGRPNAGKSTLLNACYGEKVAITSPVAQTTRRRRWPSPRRWPRPPAAACAPWSTARTASS